MSSASGERGRSPRIARVDSFTSEGIKAVLDDGRRLTLSAGASVPLIDSAAATADVVEPTLGDAPDTSSLSGGVSGAPSGGAA